MKLINSSYQILNQPSGLEGIYKQIEIAGRTCYKSENNITKDSSETFVNNMIKSGHGAMLEHGTVYLHITTYGDPITNENYDLIQKYATNKFSKVLQINVFEAYVTTNYRVIMQGYYSTYREALENNFDKNWKKDLDFICEPTHNIKRISVKFICDRGISHEFVRHRVFSFAQESTRQWRH